MTNVLATWYRKYFSDPETVILAILLLLGLAVVVFIGDMLVPVLAAAIFAYLLEGLVQVMERRGAPRLPTVILVFIVFLAFLIIVIFGFMPLLSRQLTQLVQELPNMIAKGQQALLQLPENYPNFLSEEQVKDLIAGIKAAVGTAGQQVVSLSLASIAGLFMLLVYLVLVPVLVFFFLKDKEPIFQWLGSLLPRERGLATRIWNEMNVQIGNYVRGKFTEILIVGGVTYLVFALMGLNYAMLLGALVGLSVIIPYIGAAAVTIPVALIAYFQWSWSSDFAWLMVAYGVIQALDGNVLVPLLFSEAVNLHPIAIIIAVLFFGGVWGFWGVFFAIPLATLVKAILNAWPRADETASGQDKSG
jgi:putative permease